MALFRRLQARLRLLSSGKGPGWRMAALGLLALAGFIVPNATHAGQCGLSDPVACVAMIFVWIFQILTALMGYILILEVDALIKAAQYFNFVAPGPTAVRVGWIVTRDLANMFFIVFLLIIAFSTAIGYEKYHYQKNLKTLVFMAIVINFSKTLCGLLIDASQVIMLSFVNGFKAAAAGNFLNAFQINKLLQLSEGQQDQNFGLVLAMMLAFVMAATAACIMLIMLAIMVFRIVMLWVLIILSPIAFLTKAFPFESNYYSEWWGELKKYLIGGPVIAFFLWLALVTAQQTGGQLSSPQEGWPLSSTATQSEFNAAQNGQIAGTSARIPSEAGRTDTLLSLVIIISILFAGLKFATQEKTAGFATGFAKSVRGRLEKTLKGATYGSAVGGAKWAAGPALTGASRQLAKVPVLGALGRVGVATGEKWKKERQAALEKRFGSLDDMARLSPGSFERELRALSGKTKLDDLDKKRLDSMLGIGLKNPSLVQRMAKTGAGAQAIDALVHNSKGKGLQDAVGTLTSDKNAKQWAKNNSDFLGSVYGKLKSEWKDKDGNVLDPNMAKTVSEFEQKFAPQLVNAGLLDQAKLRELVPRMAADDLGEVEKPEDLAMLAPHMLGNQFRKILGDGKPKQIAALTEAFNQQRKDANGNELPALFAPDQIEKLLTDKGVSVSDLDEDHLLGLFDNPAVAAYALKKSRGDAKGRGELMANPVRAKALQQAAQDEFKAAYQGPPETYVDPTTGQERVNNKMDPAKVMSSLVDGIALGQVSSETIKESPVLQGMIVNRLNTGDLAKSVNRSSSPQAVEAAKTALAYVMADNTAKAKNMQKQEMYQDILPSDADVEAAGREDRVALDKEAKTASNRKATETAAVSAAAAIEGEQALAGFDTALKEARKQLEVFHQMSPVPGETNAGADAVFMDLNRRVKNLESLGARRAAQQKERSTVEERLAKTASTETAALEVMKKTLSNIDKNLKKTEDDIVKSLNALKEK